jgi:transcriptional regulator with XRE-family HTH domain
MRKKTTVVTAVSRLRKRLGLNQSEFWNRLGVTQSAGSRYEKGRRMRKPIALLIDLAYGDKAQQALKKLRDW